MLHTTSPRFLTNVLRTDGASCLVTGAVQVAGSGSLAVLFGLPANLPTASGVFLLGYGLVALWIASLNPKPRPVVAAIALGNVGWALGCIALLAAGRMAPTVWGSAWVLVQVTTVLVLACLQWMGLRRIASATPTMAAAR